MRRGMRGNMGSGFEGIREMMERLKQQSRERLERYNLASLIDELKKRLEEIVQMERDSLVRKTPAWSAEAALTRQGGQAARGRWAAGSEPGRSDGQAPQAGQQGQGAGRADGASRGSQARQGRQARAGAGEQAAAQQFLEGLPPDFAGRVKDTEQLRIFRSCRPSRPSTS